MSFNTETTDISSEIDHTLSLENETFDKQELIIWASKLELESIDYRTTSIELIENLSKISKQLTDSLKSVKEYIFKLKIDAFEKDRKLKNFIELTISDEFDTIFDKILLLTNKIKNIQSEVNKNNNNLNFERLENKLDDFIKLQKQNNKIYETKLKDLKLIIEETNNFNKNDDLHNYNKKISELNPKSKPQCKTKNIQKINQRSKTTKITKYNSKRTTTTSSSSSTRKLIFD